MTWLFSWTQFYILFHKPYYIFQNYLNFYIKSRCLSILRNYLYICYHFFSWLIILGSFIIFYFSSTFILSLIHNTQWFHVLFYYINEMKWKIWAITCVSSNYCHPPYCNHCILKILLLLFQNTLQNLFLHASKPRSYVSTQSC